IAVIISGIVALTLTPALCAIMLSEKDQQPPKLMRKFNHFFDKATEKYTDGVRFMLKRTALGVSLFVAIIAVSLLLFSRLPSGLVPTEDQGFVQAAHYLPDGASFERNGEFTAEWNEKLRNHPLIDSVLSFNG